VRADKSFFKYFEGQLIVGYLNGTDNVNDYRFIGRVDAGGELHLFSKVRAYETPERIARLRRAFEILNSGVAEAGQAYARQSGNCWRCNRLLTTPESLDAGIGPVCAEKMGAVQRLNALAQAA
ncbi:MAG: DUF6011 domain-containing protein, partial [Acidobacteria bacterium]|nr:DUF6011 domain-containing protein [Acidobacteriota bacterium]